MLIKILLTFSVSILLEVSGSYGQEPYFILNAECSSQYSCLGAHDSSLAVVCINARCICDPRLGIYDRLRYQCVGKAEHACLGNTCTRNAVCEGSSNTCKCHPGYDLNLEGHCVHGHEGTCEEDEDCKSGLLCFDGKCECRYPNHQFYHTDNETCYSIAQAWDSNFKNSNGDSDSNRESTWFRCLEMLLGIAKVGTLVAIILVLVKIGMTLKEIVGTFKLHGYFLRSGMESTKMQEGSSIQIESASFFDDGKV